MGKRKNGYLTALILAVVCFAVIYLFMPSVSQRFFGSAYNITSEEVVQKIKDQAMIKLEESMTEAIKEGKVKLPDGKDLSSVNLSNFDFSLIGLNPQILEGIDLSDVDLSEVITKLDTSGE